MSVKSGLFVTETVEVSSDYKIVIPREVRISLGIHPGQKLQAIVYRGRLELVPLITPQEARGSMPGLDSTVERDEDRV